MIPHQSCQVGLFQAQSSQSWLRFKVVGLKILFGLLTFFGLISSWLALANSFGLFTLKTLNITIPFLSATHLQISLFQFFRQRICTHLQSICGNYEQRCRSS